MMYLNLEDFYQQSKKTKIFMKSPQTFWMNILQITFCQKSDQTEYEPTTIRNMISSIERHLKRHRYPVKIMTERTPTNFSSQEMPSGRNKEA